MRYIRTKDGRIVDSSQCKICENLVGKPLDPKKGWLIYEENILKQDDNIVNLFDRFVICFPTHHDYEITDDLEYAENFYDCDCVTNVYGAIFTETGLIYVAKVNSKGKWELL